jgi:hypothetical protein
MTSYFPGIVLATLGLLALVTSAPPQRAGGYCGPGTLKVGRMPRHTSLSSHIRRRVSAQRKSTCAHAQYNAWIPS